MRRWNKGLVLFALALWLGGPTVSDSEGSDDRIVGGSVTAASVFPWQAAVVLDASRFSGTDAQRQFCGGTLLTSRVVQTAAHCIADTDPDGPGRGWTRQRHRRGPGADDAELRGGRAARRQALYVSPAFSPATNANDFAWIVLAADASLGSTEQTIQVAGPDEAALWAPGAPTRVSGWGNTAEGGQLQRPAEAGARPDRRGLALRRHRRLRRAVPGREHGLRRSDGGRSRLLPGRQRRPARLAGRGRRVSPGGGRQLGNGVRAREQAGRLLPDRRARRAPGPGRRKSRQSRRFRTAAR